MPSIKHLYGASLGTALTTLPGLALANADAERNALLGGGGAIAGLVALALWYLSVQLCRKGGGWILFGVMLGVFIALPLTGYALMGLGMFYVLQP